MEVIYIGEKFYWESDTRMSSIYMVEPSTLEPNSNFYMRIDWGIIRVELEKGQSVHIRPATRTEMGYFEDRLHTMKIKGDL